MKVVIPGGAGQVGTVLVRAFERDGHEVVVLSRLPAKIQSPAQSLIQSHSKSHSQPAPQSACRIVKWDGVTVGEWARELDGANVVINLAGRSVNCRYHARNRREIMDSRIESTRAVGQAIAQTRRPPQVWLQASTATIYAHRFDAPNDEISGIIGGNEPEAPDAWKFSIDVAIAWENAANEISTPSTRKVLMRSAMTMNPDPGGIFDTLLGMVRRGLGGTSGSGRQYVSWIHERDFIQAVYWLIEHPELDGPVNLAAPHPIPNAEFMRGLRQAWGIKLGLPATKLMLEIGAILLRTETELILKSRRVIPTRLLRSGFTFEFPNWSEAAVDLCQRWRTRLR